MSEPVNLNKARKDRARTARKAQADENAVKFGRSKAQKNRDETRAQRETVHLDGHKRSE